MHVWSLAVVVFVAKLQAYDFHSESTRPNISLIAVASILSYAELSFAKYTRHLSSFTIRASPAEVPKNLKYIIS